MRHLGKLAILALTALLLTPASSPGDQEGSYDDRTDVVLVQIPVHVTLKGEPVRGLQPSDFEVLEGRKKRKIVAMDVFDLELLDESDLTSQIIPPAARRNFLFLFDLSNAVPAGVIRAQEAALEVVDGALHPSDVAGVATYSQANGLEVLLGFTPDRTQLRATLQDLGLVDPHLRVSDPLRLTMLELADSLAESGAGDSTIDNGRARPNADQIYLEALRDLSTFRNRDARDILKEQITDLSAELEALAELLDSMTGRKQVVFFSQGFDSEVVFGTQDPERIREITENVQFGEIWRVDSEERFGAGDAQTTLLGMLESLRRSDCVVHTVDTGGLRTGASATATRYNAESGDLSRGHDGLFMVANQTGGEFYRNTNDLGEAMDDLLTRTSLTYVLSIEPSSDQLDGSYHPLKVRLKKKAQRGVDISHRTGYYARRSYADLGPAARQMSTAELLVSGAEGGSILSNVLAAPFGTDGEEAYVLTAVEIDGDSLLRGQVDNVVPAEIYTYAFDEEGRVRDFFTQAVALDLYKVGYRLQTGFKLLSHLRLPPGRYELRTLIRNAETGATGLTRTPVEVPDFHNGSPVLMPPFFIESEDRWLVGDGKREGFGDDEYPLMARGSRLVPASRPLIPVGHRIPMLVVGTRLPEDARAEASFRQLGAPGEPESFDVELGSQSSDLSGVERMTAHLRASGLRAGEYELLLTLTGADGTAVTSSIPVSVIETTF
jgi:VWFA-related protein